MDGTAAVIRAPRGEENEMEIQDAFDSPWVAVYNKKLDKGIQLWQFRALSGYFCSAMVL